MLSLTLFQFLKDPNYGVPVTHPDALGCVRCSQEKRCKRVLYAVLFLPQLGLNITEDVRLSSFKECVNGSAIQVFSKTVLSFLKKTNVD